MLLIPSLAKVDAVTKVPSFRDLSRSLCNLDCLFILRPVVGIRPVLCPAP